MTDQEIVDDFLKHYGVKGMRWGVRTDSQGHVTSLITKDRKSVDQRAVALAQLDPSLRGDMKRSLDKLPSIYKEAKRNVDAGLIAINKYDRYKDADLTDPNNELTKNYHREVSKMVTRQLDVAGVLKTKTKDTFVLAFDYDSSVGGNPKTVAIGGLTSLATSKHIRQQARAEQRAVRTKASIYTQPERQAARNKVVRNLVLAAALVRAANLTWNAMSQGDDEGFQISPEFDEKGLIMTIGFPDIENDVSHSAAIDFLEQALEHSGVKGMRWGVRKDYGHVGEQAKMSTIKRADKKFEKLQYDPSYSYKIDAYAVVRTRDESHKVSRKPEYNKPDFSWDSPVGKKYESELQDIYLKHVNDGAKAIGTNASGTREYSVKTLTLSSGKRIWALEPKDVKHAETNGDSWLMRPILDDKDHLIDLVRVDPAEAANLQFLEHSGVKGMRYEMFHADETFDTPDLEAFLEHYGKKGMKWGVRNGRPTSSASRPKSAAPKKPSLGQKKQLEKKKFEDAKADRKKSLSEMSDQELQRAISRMNLERQYNQMVPVKDTRGRSTRAAEFMSATLKDSGQAAIKDISKEVAKNALRLTVKRSLGKYGDVLLPAKGDKKDDKKGDKKDD